MLKLKCEDTDVKLLIDEQERLSMLFTGGSRMGKTYLVSLLGELLIRQGYIVHMIDLGMKWTEKDRRKIKDGGGYTRSVALEKVVLSFPSGKSLMGCSKYMLDALGLHSSYGIVCVRNIFIELIEEQEVFCLKHVAERLKGRIGEDEHAARCYERFGMVEDMPDVWFQINEEKAIEDAGISMVWDLDGLENSHVQVVTQLILYWLLCSQRSRIKSKAVKKKIFAIVDEFQNMDCSQRSIIGVCLTEGQKYNMFLMLITQFVQGKFSEAVINQFKQGGFRFYFRLSEEEAADVSRKLAKNTEERKLLYSRLINLPTGCCLMLGRHTLGEGNVIYESPRFVKVIDEEGRGSKMVSGNKGRSCEKKIFCKRAICKSD